MVMRMRLAVTLCILLGSLSAGADVLVLDQTAQFRRYYRFGEDQISPVALKAEGEKVLGPQVLDRVRRSTEPWLTTSKMDHYAVWRWSGYQLVAARKVGTLAAEKLSGPARDWRDYVFRRMFYDPYTAPPPPEDWTAGDFDDSTWPPGRGTFQVDLPDDRPDSAYTGNIDKMDVGDLQFLGAGIQSCYYRTRFTVDDPDKAGTLSLSLTYRGGVRVFLNGAEIARGHLPTGNIGPEVPGEDYPLEAYSNPSVRPRTLGPVNIKSTSLRAGVNVLAVEVRASLLHPAVLSSELKGSWNSLHDREGLWRHVHLTKLQLHATGQVPSPLKRPAGVQVWTADIHQRVLSTDFPPPGEPNPVLRLVGARNGTFSAQVVVGADHDLPDLQAAASELTLETGGTSLPASTVRVLHMLPFPTDEFTDKLGDERGLDASFPNPQTLARYESMSDTSRPMIFDHLSPWPSVRLPAGCSRPVWISIDVPGDAAPGTYNGTVELRAQGMQPIAVPVELEVTACRLPDPRNFKTFVACEQNPYAVARQYGVKLWSDEHFKLMQPSFRQMARIGNNLLNVPVLSRTEFGNRDDSPIKWTRKKNGSFTWDYSNLDRYLDLAVKSWGKPRAIVFHIMPGFGPRAKGGGGESTLTVFDETSGKNVDIPAGIPSLSPAQKQELWIPFARALYAHMRSKGLNKSMRWGYPMDDPPDPEMIAMLGQALPDVKWVAGPHQISSGNYTQPQYYDIFEIVRYFNNWPSFRMTGGWKLPVAHLTLPRIDSSVQSLSTVSHPFAFRCLVEHSLALGRAGFCRVGADDWAATHYDGMSIPTWIVGFPVLFTLWPGPDGAESSARFEALLEGIQEGETRIAMEDSGAGRNVLHANFRETSFFQNKLCIHELEQYYYRWQDRSRALYRSGRSGSSPSSH